MDEIETDGFFDTGLVLTSSGASDGSSGGRVCGKCFATDDMHSKNKCKLCHINHMLTAGESSWKDTCGFPFKPRIVVIVVGCDRDVGCGTFFCGLCHGPVGLTGLVSFQFV